MNRLLHMLDIVRGRPGMVFLNRHAILDAAQDVLIDAECSALCLLEYWNHTEPIPSYESAEEACTKVVRDFERARGELER